MESGWWMSTADNSWWESFLGVEDVWQNKKRNHCSPFETKKCARTPGCLHRHCPKVLLAPGHKWMIPEVNQITTYQHHHFEVRLDWDATPFGNLRARTEIDEQKRCLDSGREESSQTNMKRVDALLNKEMTALVISNETNENILTRSMWTSSYLMWTMIGRIPDPLDEDVVNVCRQRCESSGTSC